jgi:hypothetical protein
MTGQWGMDCRALLAMTAKNAMTSQRRNDGHHFVIARSAATRQSMKTMFFHSQQKISPETLFAVEQFSPIGDACLRKMKSKKFGSIQREVVQFKAVHKKFES